MTKEQQRVLLHVQKANKAAETAFWQMKNINANDIDNLGVMSKIQDVIELLRVVDKLTIDITITLKKDKKETK